MDGTERRDLSTGWRERARCATVPDPDIFFPDRTTPADEALAICIRCPVMLACRTYALGAQERDGVWGGLTEDERRHLLPTSGSGRARRRPSTWTGLMRRRIGA